jgi:Zn-dependent protease with chaperone function
MIKLHPRPTLRRLGPVLTAFALLAYTASTVQAAEPAQAPQSEKKIRVLVDRTRKRLELPQKVSVEIVESNPLKASVRPVKDPKAPFMFSIERAFLAQLSQDELQAVVAHELGHVWIYTHHPYLQTEQLANTIALRVTTIDTLVQVYGKVWSDETLAGNLPRLPDQPQTAAGIGKPSRTNVK